MSERLLKTSPDPPPCLPYLEFRRQLLVWVWGGRGQGGGENIGDDGDGEAESDGMIIMK